MAQPCWHNANVFFGPASMGLPTRIENAYELLDQPREWYLDRPAGWIYYKPARGENLANQHIEAAATQVLVNARGTAAHPVSNLRFKGLTFAYATWMGVSGPEGYADDQTGFRVTGPDQPQTFEHAEFTTRTPGNLRFAYARHVTIRDNRFRHLGAVGVDFATGSQHNTIAGNGFKDISAAAIQLGGVDAIDQPPDRRGTGHARQPDRQQHDHQGGPGVHRCGGDLRRLHDAHDDHPQLALQSALHGNRDRLGLGDDRPGPFPGVHRLPVRELEDLRRRRPPAGATRSSSTRSPTTSRSPTTAAASIRSASRAPRSTTAS